MSRPLCLVFDLDDTLFLERDFVVSGFAAVGEWAKSRLGIEDFQQRAWRHFINGRRKHVFNATLVESGIEDTPERVAEMIMIYREHWPNISLANDATTCLDRFRGRARFAIVSDGHRNQQMQKCKALGLLNCFDQIVINDREEIYKPHARGYLEVIQKCGDPEANYVYIGDNPIKDFSAPLALNWWTVRIRRPEGLHFLQDNLPEATPHVELCDLTQLQDNLPRT